MTTMTVADAKNHFSDLLRRAEYGGERVVVARHGKPVAAIVSTDDLRRLEALEDAADVRDAQRALDEAARAGTIPLDAVLRKHGLSHLLPPSAVSGRSHPATRTTRRAAAHRARPAVKRSGRR